MLLMEKPLYTTEQVAQRLQVTEFTVREWLKQGKMTGFKAGRSWRISDEDITEFLRKSQEERQNKR